MLLSSAYKIRYVAMAGTREIKGRVKAVGNIKRITKTMQMIATARFQAALRRATASKPFTKKIAKLVAELATQCGGKIDHPLLRTITEENKTGKILLLVLSSNRGLCGGYNGHVLRAASKELAKSDVETVLEVVGKKGHGFFKFAGTEMDVKHDQFGDKPEFSEVEILADRYMQAFADGEYDCVKICYMSFQSTSTQQAKILQLLPMAKPVVEGDEAGIDVAYDYSPTPEELLQELLPTTVKTQLFQCFNESVVSEQVARMIAMKAATDSADRMSKDLKRQFNRARQASITTELSEIIAGAASLE